MQKSAPNGNIKAEEKKKKKNPLSSDEEVKKKKKDSAKARKQCQAFAFFLVIISV